MLSLVKEIKAAGNANVLQYEHSSMTRDVYFNAVILGQYAGEALGKVLANMYSRECNYQKNKSSNNPKSSNFI